MNGRSDHLHVHDRLPEGLLAAAPQELHRLLGGPSLIHLPGRRGRPLFVSCLLHGNEHSGFLAVRDLLRAYRARELPRPLSIFIGNVRAAACNLRRLDVQPDYNRVWPGGDDRTSPEARIMAEVTETMRARRPIASIDIHNNTGRNPHYACINRLEREFLHLANMFGRLVVYFTEPHGVQAMAFADFCPATTLECGHSGDPLGVEKAKAMVDACLHMDHLPTSAPHPQDLAVYHTVATVRVPADVGIGFGDETADLCFPRSIEYWNFRELPEGTEFARQHPRLGNRIVLEVEDTDRHPATDRFFVYEAGLVRLTRMVIPSMLTRDETVIRQDVLCYFMEEIVLSGLRDQNVAVA